MINYAIEKLNSLIRAANKIPGVNISTIGKANFAEETALQEAKAREQRKKDAAAEMPKFPQNTGLETPQGKEICPNMVFRAQAQYGAVLTEN